MQNRKEQKSEIKTARRYRAVNALVHNRGRHLSISGIKIIDDEKSSEGENA